MSTKIQACSKAKRSFSCVYCGKTWISGGWRRGLDRRHCYHCPVMPTLEPKRICKYCRMELPESKWCLHEVKCLKNPEKLTPINKVTVTTKPVKCPACEEVIPSHNRLKSHATNCLTSLKELIDKNYGRNKVGFCNKRIDRPLPEGITLYECRFCHNKLRKGSFHYHSVACRSVPIQYFSNRKCRQCNIEQPLWESLLHEATCSSNKKDILKCVNCSHQEYSMEKSLVKHLYGCVDELRALEKDMFVRTAPASIAKPATSLKEPRTLKPPIKAVPKNKKYMRGTHRCPFCKDGPFTRANLYYHLMFCKSFRPFQTLIKCSVCQVRGAKTTISAHEGTCRSKKKCKKRRFRCPICKEKFQSSSGQTYHLSKECLKDYLEDMVKKHSSQDDNISEESSTRLEPEPEVEAPASSVTDTRSPSVKPEVDGGCEKEDIVFLGTKVKIEECDRKQEVPKESNAGLPVITEVMSMSQPSQVMCPFCPKVCSSIEELKTKHPLACNGIKRFEPRKACSHCDLVLPTSLWGLHLLVCKKNTSKMPLTIGNLQHCDIFCPECQMVGKAKWIPVHLSTCFKHVQMIIENALANSTLEWRDSEQTDYIDMAGLTYWLQDIDN